MPVFNKKVFLVIEIFHIDIQDVMDPGVFTWKLKMFLFRRWIHCTVIFATVHVGVSIGLCGSCPAAVLVIRYAMLCGRPPFETSTLKETYERIAASRYTIPSHVAPAARDLIGRLLSHYPHDRPSLSTILRHEFFTCGYMPTSLNVNSCYTAPKFPAFEAPTPRYISLFYLIIIVVIIIIIINNNNSICIAP